MKVLSHLIDNVPTSTRRKSTVLPRSILFIFCLLSGSLVFAQSLYQSNSYQGLVTDNRARKVGDTITVMVIEAASASSSTDSQTDGSTSLSAGVSSLKKNHTGSISLNRGYTNGGQITRSGKLLARVTVLIKEITANGDYKVEGKQIITINKEKQTISIKGIVNRNTIRPDNTVMSNYLANMQVVYDGKGPLGKDKKPGLLIRIFRIFF